MGGHDRLAVPGWAGRLVAGGADVRHVFDEGYQHPAPSADPRPWIVLGGGLSAVQTALQLRARGLSAVLLIPLADVTAIQMAEVLFVTALAALVLGEKVGWRRWSAAAVGLLGVAIMVRPFGQGVETAALLALAGALFGAGGMVALRLGSAHDGTGTVLFWQGVVVLALITPAALWFWVTPSLADALMLIFMGLVFTVGQWLWTYALRMGEASALAPLNYIKLLMAGVVGWLAYGETPTLETVAGGLLVMGAATYTIHRNAQQAAKVRPATLTPS
jgi:drug/metabolite transporter (DMT)-like permease